MLTIMTEENDSPCPAPEGSQYQQSIPNVQALANVSLDIRPGEILAFMGENGAGKSTLLKIINGDYQPDSGTVSIEWGSLLFFKP